MQPEFVTRGENAQKTENAEKVKRILKIQVNTIHAAEKAGVPITFIEYSNSGKTNEML